MKHAVALVELAADSWIVTGRNPVPIMMAATYLAWQSLKPDRHRLKLSLDKFCLLANVPKKKLAMKRMSELKGVLCKLGSEIPWVSDIVTPDNVVQHVGDILQYRHALLRRALRTHEASLQAGCQTTCENPLTGETAPSQVSECVDQTPDPSAVEKRHSDAEREPQAAEEQSDTLSRDPAPNWGKRFLFAPPCVIHAKRKKVEPEINVTGDEEISDSEIDSYIRTPQEVQDLQDFSSVSGKP